MTTRDELRRTQLRRKGAALRARLFGTTAPQRDGDGPIPGIADLVDAHTSADDAERSKPDPDIFLAALHRLGDPDRAETVVVGDTPYDAEAGRKAGLRVVGVTCGGWPADDLRAAGCVAVYRHPADLLAHYEQSPLA